MRFFVVPDSAAGEAAVSSLLGREGSRTIPHASGRPWIVGRWADDEAAWAAAGRRRIAVLGRSAATRPWLARFAAGLGGTAGLDALSADLPGSFHAVAALDGVTAVQGSLSTVREVFHARVGPATVAADRPDALAALTGADIREDLLPIRLLAPSPVWPLAERSLWNGVETVPAGHRLLLEPDGRARTEPRRPPPEPDVPLAAGAERVWRALAEAVAVRAHGRGALSADLSGGMDSTSVCFLAAPHVARLRTVLQESADPGSDDGRWAALAAAALPNAQHEVHRAGTYPGNFAGLLAPDPDVEGPFPALRVRAMLVEHARRTAAAGTDRHLTGYGGDELFYPATGYLWDLLRRAPLRAVRQVRAHRSVYRWPLRPTVRALLDRTSFADWLGRDVGRELTAPIRGVNDAPLGGWGAAHRMPEWATPDAVAAVRDALTAAASGAAPLSPLRGRHLTLQCVREGGALVRRVDRLTARHGVATEAPFLDDRVVEAALAIDYADTVRADRYKPALVEAMRGVVPAASLGRRSKAEFSADVYAGLRRHRAELLDLCDGMALADRGLVDAAALRELLLAPPPFSLRLLPLLGTFACEAWLRSLPAARSTAPLGGVR
ncbi:asparagine synthase-related protein [Actinomadura atramentaria]|uniref:asparagine synthase-related protein n=1 Tax=Actinomadura atramentaria TaxID=1990 RepID=UPI00036015AB|nr:asparagine synthase-related protein [Actinomadura atramentaria]